MCATQSHSTTVISFGMFFITRYFQTYRTSTNPSRLLGPWLLFSFACSSESQWKLHKLVCVFRLLYLGIGSYNRKPEMKKTHGVEASLDLSFPSHSLTFWHLVHASSVSRQKPQVTHPSSGSCSFLAKVTFSSTNLLTVMKARHTEVCLDILAFLQLAEQYQT